jgi:hypothetical protein
MPGPINPINVFDTNFMNAPHLELASHVISIGEAFIAHSLYTEVPPGVPHGTEIKDVGTRYHDLSYAVMTGVSGSKSERDAYREKAVLAISLALTYAGMRYLRENNFELITNLGVEHKKQKSQTRHTAPSEIGAPDKVQLVYGNNSGTLRVLFPKVPGAILYYVQACLGDPNDEAAWNKEWQFTKIRGGVELTGLEPGKVYYFRVRCLGHAGLGPWSAYVHIMVV